MYDPTFIFKAYAEHRISRLAFVQKMGAWQKAHGYNYDVKGYANKHGIFISYRDIVAQFRDGSLNWSDKTGKHRAYSVNDFKYQVNATNRVRCL